MGKTKEQAFIDYEFWDGYGSFTVVRSVTGFVAYKNVVKKVSELTPEQKDAVKKVADIFGSQAVKVISLRKGDKYEPDRVEILEMA